MPDRVLPLMVNVPLLVTAPVADIVPNSTEINRPAVADCAADRERLVAVVKVSVAVAPVPVVPTAKLAMLRSVAGTDDRVAEFQTVGNDDVCRSWRERRPELQLVSLGPRRGSRTTAADPSLRRQHPRICRHRRRSERRPCGRTLRKCCKVPCAAERGSADAAGRGRDVCTRRSRQVPR